MSNSTPLGVAVPVSEPYIDIYPLTTLSNVLKRTMTVKGAWVKRIWVLIKVTLLATQASAATGTLSQVLTSFIVSQATQGSKGLTLVNVDGLSAELAARVDDLKGNDISTDAVVTGLTATSYICAIPIGLNAPSKGALTFVINAGVLTDITGLTVPGNLEGGVIVESTDDLVGKPYVRYGSSFVNVTNFEFYDAAEKTSQYTSFEVAVAATADMVGFKTLTVPDGSLGPSEIQQLEVITMSKMGVGPGQAPVTGGSAIIALGNTTDYFMLLYRSKSVGNAAFNAPTNFSGAYVSKFGLLASQI